MSVADRSSASSIEQEVEVEAETLEPGEATLEVPEEQPASSSGLLTTQVILIIARSRNLLLAAVQSGQHGSLAALWVDWQAVLQHACTHRPLHSNRAANGLMWVGEYRSCILTCSQQEATVASLSGAPGSRGGIKNIRTMLQVVRRWHGKTRGCSRCDVILLVLIKLGSFLEMTSRQLVLGDPWLLAYQNS